MRRLLTAPFELYRAAGRARGRAYDCGLLPVRRVAGISVVSVGNLSAGGSGKTPFSIHLAAALAARGLPTSLVLRGYGGRLERRGGLVSEGGGRLLSPEEAGDEAFLAAGRLPGVRVRVGADRVAAVRAEAEAGSRVAVLDDGFQHRRIHRDLDVLLVRPSDRNPGSARLPPALPREPWEATERADLLAGSIADWEGLDGAPPLLFDLEPTAAIDRRWRAEPLAGHAGARAWLLSGIARPERFVTSARRAGLGVAGHSAFPDHHRFRRFELERVEAEARAAGATLLLATEKDLPRLMHLGSELLLRALRVEQRIVCGEEILARRVESVV
ncbi:MAG: tetraacyldisaccharide 4'-kinase [Polyangia bacterium]